MFQRTMKGKVAIGVVGEGPRFPFFALVSRKFAVVSLWNKLTWSKIAVEYINGVMGDVSYS